MEQPNSKNLLQLDVVAGTEVGQQYQDQTKIKTVKPAAAARPDTRKKKPGKGKHDEEPWIRVEQWIEIKVKDGKTVTRYFPSNDQVKKMAADMDPEPDVVFRRLRFVGRVPSEYYWTNPNKDLRAYGGGGIQRMTWEAWLDCVERENGGHVGPAKFGKLKRWGTEEEQ